VDFVDAIGALEDPDRIQQVDDRFDDGEDRMRVIGMASSRILFVVATLRDHATCRIISARRATRNEQDRYYASDRDAW
jgi:uncharacterized DUF497 family protein